MRLSTLAALGLGVWILSASAAGATNYYVRTDGNDACTGLADSAGSGGSCAFKTIAKCEAVAGCGDTCNVRAGEYFEPASITISDVCASGSEKRIVGAGKASTRVFALAVAELRNCTLKSGSSTVYACDVPAGARTAADAYICFSQKMVGGAYLEDDNGVKGEMTGYACMTPVASYSGVDSNDDGAADTTLDSPAAQGMWFHDSAANKFNIHPWNDEGPGSGARWFVPSANIESSYTKGFYFNGANSAVLKDLTVVSAGNNPVYLQNATNVTLDGVDIYGGKLWIDDTVKSSRINRVLSANAYRRAVGAGCGSASNPCIDGWTSSQTCVFRGENNTWTDVECTGAREGASFAGRGHTVRGLKTHFHHNHGFKMDSELRDTTFENVFSYNAQEAVYLMNCAANITFRHCTFRGTFFVLGKYGDPATCASGVQGPYNIDVYNSQIEKVAWSMTFGDPRAGARDHDFDHNVYTGSTHHSHNGNSMSVTEFQSYSSDSCTNCLRDPNGVGSTDTAEFVAPATRDDTVPRVYNFDLKSTAKGVNFGATAYAPVTGKDVDGVGRAGNPDSGAWEYEGAGGGSVCGNAVKETGEACDGADLGGATCQSLGLPAGTLACTAACQYDTSGCQNPNNPPPSNTGNLRREDVR